MREIAALKKSGKIRGYKVLPHPAPPGRKGKGKSGAQKVSPQKIWMHWFLIVWCSEQSLTLKTEYRFLSDRKFAFDFAILEPKIAIEYEGLNSEKSGHTTLLGYTSNTDKYNLAAADGWNLIRFTVLNYKTLPKRLDDVFNNDNQRNPVHGS